MLKYLCGSRVPKKAPVAKGTTVRNHLAHRLGTVNRFELATDEWKTFTGKIAGISKGGMGRCNGVSVQKNLFVLGRLYSFRKGAWELLSGLLFQRNNLTLLLISSFALPFPRGVWSTVESGS